MDDHINREEFLIDFFGMFARELATPDQFFTDNPRDIIQFVEDCRIQKKPAFISVNPRIEHDKVLGIEKLFFDFDFGKKKEIEKLSVEEIEERKKNLQKEVEIFLANLQTRCITPLVIKTRRGFHIHIYLDKVYILGKEDDELLKETYFQLQLPFIESKKHGYKFMDTSVLGDYKRMCRIPTSIHQESGEECYLVKGIVGDKITKDKLRGIDYYRLHGLKSDSWLYAVDRAIDKITKERAERLKKEQERELHHEEEWEMAHGFVGEIRPCFKKRIISGEMCHQMRLALEIEAYWAGYKTEEGMLEVFRKFHDFNEKIARDQIAWFFKNKVPDIEKNQKWKPYRCTTIEDLNWCDKSQCPIYVRRKEKYGQKTKKK